MMRRLAAIFTVHLLLVACGPREYEDVSDYERFRSLIGEQYYSIKPLKFHKINPNVGGNDSESYFVVLAPPGAGGPEVVSSEYLAEGSLFTVTHVVRCKNCFPTTFYAVMADFVKAHADRVYSVRMSRLLTNDRGAEVTPYDEDGEAFLNRDYFEKVHGNK